MFENWTVIYFVLIIKIKYMHTKYKYLYILNFFLISISYNKITTLPIIIL